MNRRQGNNYSGPQWMFSTGTRQPQRPTTERSGISLSGGSNRKTEVHRPGDCPDTGEAESKCTCQYHA